MNPNEDILVRGGGLKSFACELQATKVSQDQFVLKVRKLNRSDSANSLVGKQGVSRVNPVRDLRDISQPNGSGSCCCIRIW